ncbi:MAG: 3-carboxy-cis,cis-muconate cycloisomerase, partial [Gammaproteobacteria bacterium]
NPVQAETIVSLFRISQSLDTLMNNAVLHRQQRDGSAWMQEWFALPQLVMSTAKSMQLATDLLDVMEVNRKNMLDRVDKGSQLAYAEAASFELSREMPRAISQTKIKQLCSEAIASGIALSSLLEKAYPQVEWTTVFSAKGQMGDSLVQVNDFVTRVNALS